MSVKRSSREILPADQRVTALLSEENANLDALYEKLKDLWEANPWLDRVEIMNQLKNFVAEDGSTPFQGIRAHTGALAQIMAHLKSEGGENLPVYKELESALLFSVASNGILNSFISTMTA